MYLEKIGNIQMSFPLLSTAEIPRSTGDRLRNRSSPRLHDRSTLKTCKLIPSSTASVAVDLPREATLSAMDGNDLEVLHSSRGPGNARLDWQIDQQGCQSLQVYAR